MTPPPDTNDATAALTNAAPHGLERTRVWVFDLDNTLYPADCNLFAQVDHRMGEFIQKHLDVPYEYARHLQKRYYRQFGTTLAGLMKIHKMEPAAFLEYVHDIDLTPVPEHPELAAAIEALPGRKLIFPKYIMVMFPAKTAATFVVAFVFSSKHHMSNRPKSNKN